MGDKPEERGVTVDPNNVPAGLKRTGYGSLRSHQNSLMATGSSRMNEIEARRAGYSEEEIRSYFGRSKDAVPST